MKSISFFTAHVIPGAGRGKKLGSPTLNLNLDEVPAELEHGIYAAFAEIRNLKSEIRNLAVLHYGPRPVFHDNIACEVHVLDTNLSQAPTSVSVEIVQKIRDVQDFDSEEDLRTKIAEDIAQARDILMSS